MSLLLGIISFRFVHEETHHNVENREHVRFTVRAVSCDVLRLEYYKWVLTKCFVCNSCISYFYRRIDLIFILIMVLINYNYLFC